MGASDRVCRGHLSERVAADQIEPIRRGVEGYKHFRKLADEFADVSEQIPLQTGNLPAIKKRVWLSSSGSFGTV